jgi:lysophospholipase L1-like esterase
LIDEALVGQHDLAMRDDRPSAQDGGAKQVPAMRMDRARVIRKRHPEIGRGSRGFPVALLQQNDIGSIHGVRTERRSEYTAVVRRRAALSSVIARSIPHLLLIGILITTGVIARRWAYATTFHLFLDQRIDDSPGSSATQRFDLEGSRVVPKILMRDDRVIFRTRIGQNSTIRADVQASNGAGFEVHVRQKGVDQVVARAESLSTPVSVRAAFPWGSGDVEIVSRGAVLWSNLRVERGINAARPLFLLGLLCALLLAWTAWFESHGLRTWASTFVVFTSVLVSLVAVEAMLRVVGNRVSTGISALRHDLGEPTEDPRWQQTSRYGKRLRLNVDTMGEWRYGDIIRMGFVPQAEGPGKLHRYPFRTDSEGFRNDAPRDAIEVAALGDSFTDALTMRREDAWPARLERLLGRPVQNYGTAGFGPQQELRVLKDFALRRKPRLVILAFFAGNDIRDAETFEQFLRDEASPNDPKPGWPIKTTVMRADTWYLTSAVQAASQVLFRRTREPDKATTPQIRGADGQPSFRRGMFNVVVNGLPLRLALMPPYLNLLNFDEREMSARRGWALVESTLMEMQQASRSGGAEFVVVFIPFKSQITLPLLARVFPRAALEEALHFYARDSATAPDVDRMLRNRLVQNVMMARFCARAGIPLLDLTDALQTRFEAGENMYFPDDSHLDESGEALVAERLAAFLELGLFRLRSVRATLPNAFLGR